MRKLHFAIICMMSLTVATRADATTYVTSSCKMSGMGKSAAGASSLQDTL
ncbi:MAG: hypothetical protein JW913_20620 [Chitinispirillaceae bacterium]|nr:hypothetical protein [Chitinispirillaceae bacterium]